MVFCEQCGKKLASDARFCPGCGHEREVSKRSASANGREVFAGKVLRCPSCGSRLASLTAICPYCKHEINSAEVDPTLREFSEKLDEADRQIAASGERRKTGWSSWNGLIKTCWVILNVITLCIPLLIYLAVRLFRYTSKPKLTVAEHKKASLIENFPFPNDRESTIEALLLIRTKMDFIDAEKLDHHNAFWMRQWAAKANQLEQKADIILRDDPVVENICQTIEGYEKKTKRKIHLRRGLGCVLLLVLLLLLGRLMIDDMDIRPAGPIEWPEAGMVTLLPEPPAMYGHINFNQGVRFHAEIHGVTDTQYEQYIIDCQESGFTVEPKREGVEFIAYTEEGHKLSLFKFSKEKVMDIVLEAPMKLDPFTWPTTGLGSRLPAPPTDLGRIEWEDETSFNVYVGSMPHDQYMSYVDECFALGFQNEFNRSQDRFYGTDAEGYELRVSYESFEIVNIRLYSPGH